MYKEVLKEENIKIYELETKFNIDKFLDPHEKHRIESEKTKPLTEAKEQHILKGKKKKAINVPRTK